MRLCSTCHDSARVLANRRTRTQWEEVIQKMVERGAQGTEDELVAVQEYLLKVSGRVNVNRGVPHDIAIVTGLTDKDADAIVAYRKANGDFADFDALCKVPGIDVEKLKSARDAVSF
jgi:competence protein ComEA